MATASRFDRPRRRRGFTLVELLVTISIIVILAAILIPTVSIIRRRVAITQIALEVSQLDAAMKAYKQKYGDLPPDVTSRTLVLRHMRKVWPKMAASEQAFIETWWQHTDTDGDGAKDDFEMVPRVDSAEALVLFLGGLSEDPRFPFTGKGGPVRRTAAGIFLNPDRNRGLFDFQQPRFDLITVPGEGLLSTDESELHGRPVADNDAYPVYAPAGRRAPFVLFDARTYTLPTGSSSNPFRRNSWSAADVSGTAKPHRTDQKKALPKESSSEGYFLEFARPREFQIISAGLDDDFGTGNGRFNSGDDILTDPPKGTGYAEGDLDNVTNFSNGKSLEETKP